MKILNLSKKLAKEILHQFILLRKKQINQNALLRPSLNKQLIVKKMANNA